jgi:FlaG/FlaF family flagellin (archaellin)
MSDPYTPSLQHPAPARKSKVVSDTAVHTGEWAYAKVIAAATIAAITCPSKTNASGLIGTALSPGDYLIEGPITSIQLTSGKIELFER